MRISFFSFVHRLIAQFNGSGVRWGQGTLLFYSHLRRFSVTTLAPEPPHNAKSTIFTKKEKLFSSALHEFHYNLLESGGFFVSSFSSRRCCCCFACIKAQKIMVYLLVNTSIKVCSFFARTLQIFGVCFFNFLLTFFFVLRCCCAVVFLRGFSFFAFFSQRFLLLISRNFFHMLQKLFSRGKVEWDGEWTEKIQPSLSFLHTWSF